MTWNTPDHTPPTLALASLQRTLGLLLTAGAWKAQEGPASSRTFLSCSVTQACLTLCDPMDCSTPSFPVLRYLPEFAQTRVC